MGPIEASYLGPCRLEWRWEVKDRNLDSSSDCLLRTMLIYPQCLGSRERERNLPKDVRELSVS